MIVPVVAKRVPHNDIAEMAHEVFVQAYKSLAGYSGKAPFGNWVVRIAIRTCGAYWKKRCRADRNTVSLEANENQQWLEQMPGQSSADSELREQDTKAILKRVLEQLPPDDRTLIESIYFDDMPLKDVAAALEWSVVKTKVRALRARRRMRQLLESIGE